ncbi:hypothetical protein Emed_005130 [Eimeria media]
MARHLASRPPNPKAFNFMNITLTAFVTLHVCAVLTAAFVRTPSQPSLGFFGGSTLSPTSPSTTPLYREGVNPLRAAAASPAESEEPYDIAVVGLGVGGHAACLHAKALGLRVAAVSGGDPGGTCVNRGCIPSKALLAAARRVRVLQHTKLLNEMGIDLGQNSVKLNPRTAGNYALGVASKVYIQQAVMVLMILAFFLFALQVRGGLVGSLAAHKIPIFDATAEVEAPGLLRLKPTATSPSNLPVHLKAKNIILAPGSTPFVPPGIELPAGGVQQQEGPLQEQQNQIMTSDTAVGLPVMPSYLTIIGAGYIGLEFAEVFSAMGAEVTLIEAGDRMLPGVDPTIAQAAERILLQRNGEQPIKLLTNTLAASVKRTQPLSAQHKTPAPLEVRLKDAKTGEAKGVLFPDACLVATGRKPTSQGLGLEGLGVQLKRGGFVPVDACMRVVRGSPVGAAAAGYTEQGEPIDGLYCIGDANGLLQLAHAASTQAVTAVEHIAGRRRPFNPRIIPAACFTNPEIAFVGYTEPEALALGEKEGFEIGVSTSNFRANSKAVAEGEAEGLMKVIWRKDSGLLLGCHMIGPHAGDLMQQCANAMATDTPIHPQQQQIQVYVQQQQRGAAVRVRLEEELSVGNMEKRHHEVRGHESLGSSSSVKQLRAENGGGVEAEADQTGEAEQGRGCRDSKQRWEEKAREIVDLLL